LLLVLNALVGLLPFDLPKPVELAATSLVMTATLTWLILPRVRKLLRPWLLCDHDGELRD
jgi:antibiotic biosynthesis monooxygenase (ABM) superfamily enzyme